MFHFFPEDKNFKLKWKIILKIGKKVTNNAVVCSIHFDDSDFISITKSKGIKIDNK